jgi:glucosamine--fructose-6-phosphate aminotransferase (isomerizing)
LKKSEEHGVSEAPGFEHAMIRDIHDQPRIIQNIMKKDEMISGVAGEIVQNRYTNFFVVGCGTSFFAGLVGKHALEEYARLPTRAYRACEFIEYPPPHVSKESLIIAVSRSGETGDVLAAVKTGKQKGADVLCLTETANSSLAKVSDYVISMEVGHESLVVTKGYTAELVAVSLFSLSLAEIRNTLPEAEVERLSSHLRSLPEDVVVVLKEVEAPIERLAKESRDWEQVHLLGNGPNYATALEGALKLKEAAMVNAEAHMGSEFRHGVINVVQRGTPVIIIDPPSRTHQMMESIMRDSKKAGAAIILEGGKNVENLVDTYINVPCQIDEFLSPLLYIVPLHLLCYYLGVSKGLDVDHPAGSEMVGKYREIDGRSLYYIEEI